MEIAIVTATPQNVRLGSGTFVANAHLSTALRAQGHAVDAFSPEKSSGPLGYTAHRFMWNRALQPRQFRDYDVVVGFDMDGYAIGNRLTVPYATYIHGIIADEATFERGWVRRSLELMARAEKKSIESAGLVITTSQYSKARLKALYRYDGRIEVIPPLMDVQSWRSAVAAAEQESGRPEPSRPTVFCVAVQYPRKNVATLVRAAAILRRRIPDVQVRIAGRGPEWERLRRLAHDLDVERTTVFLGHISYRQLIREYVDCQVFCLPSLQEGFGMVFAEAMATGRPVVASRSSSTPELIEDGVQGLLARPLDAEDLAAKLEELLVDPERARAFGDAGRIKAAEFDAPIIAGQFARVISALNR